MREKLYRREEDMYPSVAAWLASYLRQSVRNCELEVLQSHRENLSNVSFG